MHPFPNYRYLHSRRKLRQRPIIVWIGSERIRDKVYRPHTRLKGHHIESSHQTIYINEDLTAQMAKLAYDACQLKRAKKVIDCWTTYGKVMVKDTTNRIKKISFLARLTQLINRRPLHVSPNNMSTMLLCDNFTTEIAGDLC